MQNAHAAVFRFHATGVGHHPPAGDHTCFLNGGEREMHGTLSCERDGGEASGHKSTPNGVNQCPRGHPPITKNRTGLHPLGHRPDVTAQIQPRPAR
jgi:hypothetical protein